MVRNSVNTRFLIRSTGQCARFNGTTSIVTVAHNASLLNADYIAMMLWLRPNPIQPSFVTPISKGNEYFIESNNSDKQSYQATFLIDGSGRASGFTTAKLLPGRRNTIVADYSSATRTIRVFVNGALDVSLLLTGLSNYTISTAGTNTLYVGNRNGFSRFFSGDIDQVAVQVGGTALSATDVSNFHYKGVVPSSNLGLNLLFNGNSNDNSGMGNNGTATDIAYSNDAFFSSRTAASERIAVSGRVAA